MMLFLFFWVNQSTDFPESLVSFDAEYVVKEYRMVDGNWKHVATINELYFCRRNSSYYSSKVFDTSQKELTSLQCFFDGEVIISKTSKPGAIPGINKLDLNKTKKTLPDGVIAHPRLFEFWGLSIPRITREFGSKNDYLISRLKGYGLNAKSPNNSFECEDYFTKNTRIISKYSATCKELFSKFTKVYKGVEITNVENSDFRKFPGGEVAVPFRTIRYFRDTTGKTTPSRKYVYDLKYIKKNNDQFAVQLENFSKEGSFYKEDGGPTTLSPLGSKDIKKMVNAYEKNKPTSTAWFSIFDLGLVLMGAAIGWILFNRFGGRRHEGE